MKSKSMRNPILELKVGDVYIEAVSDIRHQVMNHFIEILRESTVNRPCLDDIVFHSLSVDDNMPLLVILSSQELDVAIS